MHEGAIIHCIQVIVGILLCFHFTCSILNTTADFPKQYEIPLFIGFIVVARSTESIIRKSLINYYPDFYQDYKLYIFAIVLAIFLVVVYFLQKSIKSSNESSS